MIKNLFKFIVKIPKDIIVFYFDKQNIIVIKGNSNNKLIKLNLKIYINKKFNFLQITEFYLKKNKNKIKITTLQGILLTNIKQVIIESSRLLNKKLNLIGIGYKVFLLKTKYYSLLKFKFGFSHNIYYKINLAIYCLKTVTIFLLGNCSKILNKNAGIIKKFKKLDIYKGKGVFYEKEKKRLKTAKKI